MSKKDNFNQALFEMFGVRDPDPVQAVQTEGTEALAATEPLPEEPEQGSGQEPENVVRLDRPELKIVTIPTTYIAPGTRIEGTLRSEGSVEIEGEFKGDILSEGTVTMHSDITGNITAKSLSIVGCSLTGDARVTGLVTLSESSSVNGNVTADTLTSSGTIIGNLDIQHNMALDATAKVVGDISTGTMTVERGAILRGSVETRGDATIK